MSGGNCNCNSELSILENSIRDMIYELNKKLDLIVSSIHTDKQLFVAKTATITAKANAQSIPKATTEVRAFDFLGEPRKVASKDWAVQTGKFADKWSDIKQRNLTKTETEQLAEIAKRDAQDLAFDAKWKASYSNSTLWEGIKKRAENASNQ